MTCFLLKLHGVLTFVQLSNDSLARVDFFLSYSSVFCFSASNFSNLASKTRLRGETLLSTHLGSFDLAFLDLLFLLRFFFLVDRVSEP